MSLWRETILDGILTHPVSAKVRQLLRKFDDCWAIGYRGDFAVSCNATVP